jgi:hypothetical protein
MLYFGDHPLNSKTMSDYPLARYAGRNWTFHLMRCHDQATLSALTKRLLEPGSRQYAALNFLEWWDKASEEQRPMDPPLYLCTGCGYIEGVKFLLEMGDDPNAEGQLYSPSIGDGYPVFLYVRSFNQWMMMMGC